MTTEQSLPSHPVHRSAGPGQPARVVVGLLLLLPALLALLWSYVLPSVSTLVKSFQRDPLIGPVEQVGGANYDRIFEMGFLGAVGFALVLGLLPLLSALLVAPLIAVVADRAGRVARLVTRGLLALPLAGYAPVAVLVFWMLHRSDPRALSESPRLTLIWIVGVTSFGVVVGVAATFFLSAIRNRHTGGRPGRAMLVTGAVLALGIVAAALQTYTVPAVLTGGGPARATVTPVLDAMQNGLIRMDLGPGAAISTILLVVLGVLGLAAVGLLLATRARFELDGWRDRPAPPAGIVPPGGAVPSPTAPARSGGRPLFLVLLVIVLVGFLAVTTYAVLFPWLRAAFSDGELPTGASAAEIFVNTWIPPLIGALVSVTLAALGGFAIGALRPLGRWSELLLLPFAPWLFVGTGPLAIANYLRARDFDQIDTLIGLIPPGWVSIPALVAFTLLFRGQEPRWRAGGGFGRTVLLPALPLFPLAVVVSWLVSAQQVLWPWLVAQGPDTRTAGLVAQLMLQQRFGAEDAALSMVLPLPMMVLFLLVLVASQITYLDRLTLRTGPPPSPADPRDLAVVAPQSRQMGETTARSREGWYTAAEPDRRA
ncbi:sugar ABC transporter permease [Polymorphospora rubra]|uniref:sugar ABC transporter permease n=1 Tax=Polymorphospora rubra TaxID=338584 RepID=UPI0033ED4796